MIASTSPHSPLPSAAKRTSPVVFSIQILRGLHSSIVRESTVIFLTETEMSHKGAVISGDTTAARLIIEGDESAYREEELVLGKPAT